jgi:hypothetical protein
MKELINKIDSKKFIKNERVSVQYVFNYKNFDFTQLEQLLNRIKLLNKDFYLMNKK